nr:FAD-dependent oxidoreductase [Microbacterium sp. NIBRBAC000506063]
MSILVVGSGIAGLTAALHAHEAGHEVTLVTKGALGEGCTPLAQGGVAGIYGPGDSPESHAADTLVAGSGLSDPATVEVLVAEGATRIAELIARGVAFDRDADGTLLLGREAAHSHARIVHAGGDQTGAAISSALIAAVRASGVVLREHAFLSDLLVTDGVVHGIRLLIDGRAEVWEADAVILATGGAGRLHARTTNPDGATGDGIAAALRAGPRSRIWSSCSSIRPSSRPPEHLSWSRRPCAAKAPYCAMPRDAASCSTSTRTPSSLPATSSPARSPGRPRRRARRCCWMRPRWARSAWPHASRRSPVSPASAASTGPASRSR